jgi:hypothetical protein
MISRQMPQMVFRPFMARTMIEGASAVKIPSDRRS